MAVCTPLPPCFRHHTLLNLLPSLPALYALQKICFQLDLEEAKNSWKRDFNRGVSGLHVS
eukprot:scaffold64590_cov32-Tisochrysis_lutea.AAC.3